MTTDRRTFTSVNCDENIKGLRDLKMLLKTSMGPEGHAKMMVTGGYILQLTSTSNNLLARLDLEHPICRYIGNVACVLPDFGLYFGVMVSHLVEQHWIDGSLLKLKLHSSVQTLLQFVQQILISDIVCKKVDFSSINSFLPLVRTVISSKCPTFIFNVDINRFCIEIIKAFLNCIDDQTNCVGKVIVKVETGPTSISCHDGLLYQITEDHDLAFIKEITEKLRIIVFTVKLDNSESDYKNNISVIDQVMPILKQAVESNVRLVACQKTVAAEIKLYLLRQKVILIDRMGTKLTENVIQISQAFPISQICSDNFLDIGKIAGTLASVQHIEFNEASYILLKNADKSISTLLIQNYCLAGTDHLEVLTQQAINSLRYLAVHPTLTFGGGCLEIWLIAQIHLRKEQKDNKEFLKVSQWFQRSLLSACGPTPPDSVDSVYHHGWTNEGPTCKCRLVTIEMLKETEGHLILLEELLYPQLINPIMLNSPRQSTNQMSSDVLVDCHQQKLNTIVSAIETFANIADIGSILYKK